MIPNVPGPVPLHCTALRPSILKPSCARRPRLVLPQHNLSSSFARCLFVLLSGLSGRNNWPRCTPAASRRSARPARAAPGYQDEITGRAARRPPREEALAPRALPLVRPCHPDEVPPGCAWCRWT
ncbi:Transcription factor bHLH68 [Zea mays]|uniref:Transcription factor bHLH68 n=1 Tax=Zea mays TaxID=4577 RepID=A0A1Q0XX75_MAIZE|nr:Transcription factor bHLH68 [Zea mays]